LFSFTTAEEAAAALERALRIRGTGRRPRAGRELFDSDRVLSQLLEAV
jgi:hypothetical protein